MERDRSQPKTARRDPATGPSFEQPEFGGPQSQAVSSPSSLRLAREVVVCRKPFRSTPATTFIFSCADGRFAIEDEGALAALGIHETPDRQTPPGGPAVLHPLSSLRASDREIGLQHLTFLVEHHRTQRIFLVAHEDCAFYAAKFPHYDKAQRLHRQLDDLHTVAADLRQRFSKVEVVCLFAREEGGRVAIRRVIE